MDLLNSFLIFTKLCILFENKKKKIGVRGTLNMTNRTHTNERKMVQLYYLVPGCVISMFKFIFINHQRSRTVLWLLGHSGVTKHYFFKRTAKNLVTYTTSCSLTLSPDSLVLKEFKLCNKPVKLEKSYSMHLKPSCCISTLEFNKITSKRPLKRQTNR